MKCTAWVTMLRNHTWFTGGLQIVCIKSYAKRLKLSWLCANAAEMLLEAGSNAPSYDDFICNLLVHEVQGREERQRLKRLKEARLPMSHDLNQYNHSMSDGLAKTQLNQPRELHWIEEGFNLMLSGPSGVGKTYIDSLRAMFRCDRQRLQGLLQDNG